MFPSERSWRPVCRIDHAVGRGADRTTSRRRRSSPRSVPGRRSAALLVQREVADTPGARRTASSGCSDSSGIRAPGLRCAHAPPPRCACARAPRPTARRERDSGARIVAWWPPPIDHGVVPGVAHRIRPGRDRDDRLVPVHAHAVPGLDPAGGSPGPDHRRQPVLARDDRRVRHDAADVRDRAADLAEHWGPGSAR